MRSTKTSQARSAVLLSLSMLLTFVGAGCASKADEFAAIPAGDANQESSLSLGQRVQPVQLPPKEDPAPAPSATPPSEPVKPPSETTMPNDAQKPQEETGFPGVLAAERIHGKQARISTPKGEIVFELFDVEAPKTVSNFVALAERGFFDGLKFHRVVPGFVIQGGDPRGDGTGGPGYQFEDEKVTKNYDAGIVAMANSGPNTNGSQFFIVLDDQPTLPKAYTIFGRVTKGMEAVRAIVKDDAMTTVKIEAKK